MITAKELREETLKIRKQDELRYLFDSIRYCLRIIKQASNYGKMGIKLDEVPSMGYVPRSIRSDVAGKIKQMFKKRGFTVSFTYITETSINYRLIENEVHIDFSWDK